jgi:FO synthase
MGEIITRSAGASHGQEVTPEAFGSLIRAAGRVASRRTTLYEVDNVTSL